VNFQESEKCPVPRRARLLRRQPKLKLKKKRIIAQCTETHEKRKKNQNKK
jgi:hypothetical protein